MPAKAKQPEASWQSFGPGVFVVSVIGCGVVMVTLAAAGIIGIGHGPDSLSTARQLYECRADNRILQERLSYRSIARDRLQQEYETALSVCAESRGWVAAEARSCFPGLR